MKRKHQVKPALDTGSGAARRFPIFLIAVGLIVAAGAVAALLLLVCRAPHEPDTSAATVFATAASSAAAETVLVAPPAFAWQPLAAQSYKVDWRLEYVGQQSPSSSAPLSISGLWSVRVLDVGPSRVHLIGLLVVAGTLGPQKAWDRLFDHIRRHPIEARRDDMASVQLMVRFLGDHEYVNSGLLGALTVGYLSSDSNGVYPGDGEQLRSGSLLGRVSVVEIGHPVARLPCPMRTKVGRLVRVGSQTLALSRLPCKPRWEADAEV